MDPGIDVTGAAINISDAPLPSQGSVSVTIDLKPTELFNSEGSEVTDVASTNSYVLAQRVKPDGQIEFALYNEANKKINFSGAMPPGGKAFKLSTDVDEKYIILERDQTLRIYRTVDEDMRPLPPERWKIIDVPDRSKISAEQLSEYPILSDYRTDDKGRVIDGLNYSISHDRGVLTIVNSKRGTRFLSETASAYALDPNQRGQVFFISPDNSLRSVNVLDGDSRASRISVVSRPLPIEGQVSTMRFDPHGNFLAVIVEQNSRKTLKIIERDSLRVAAEIENVSGNFDFNRFGEIYFVDSSQRLRMASTNLHSFSPNGLAQAREVEKFRLEDLIRRAREVNLPDLPEVEKPSGKTSVKGSLSLRDDMVRQAQQEVNTRIAPLIDKATTVKALDKITLQIELLKAEETYRDYPQVFKDLEKSIAARVDALETERLTGALKAQRDLLKTPLDTEHLALLTEKWNDLERLRRSLVIADESVRRAVDSDFTEIRDKTRTIVEKLEARVEKALEKGFGDVERLVKDSMYLRDLSSLRATPEFIEFETAMNLLGNGESRTSWRTKYKELLREHQDKLMNRQSADEEQRRTRVAEALEDSAALLKDIKIELGEIKHTTELSKWSNRNPLILRYRAQLLSIPEELRTKQEETLEAMLNQKKQELLQTENANILRRGKQATFGNETFPVFPEQRLLWQPIVKSIPEADGKGALVWRDTAGREFKPEWSPVPFNTSDPETMKAIEATRAEAEAHFEDLKPRIPGFSSRWVLNDWSIGYLEKMAQACKEQLELGQGIIILSGESACGKDVLWKMFAHFTQRGVVNIPFNLQTEKEDITYDFEFNPKEGTKRITSKFVEAIQVPGTLCVLGEINTAPNGVVKMLNSAMDEQRSIQVPHGPPVEVDRTVILAGTMNPQHYLGTNKLAQDVLSRATVIKVTYPQLKNEDTGRVLPYEAEIMAKNIPALADISQREFYAMWDYQINKDKTSGGDKFLSQERMKLLDHIYRVVLTANVVRDLYERYHSGDNDVPPAEFVFGLRETTRIAARLKPDSKVGEIIKSVCIDKIANAEERMRVGSIIDDPENFKLS